MKIIKFKKELAEALQGQGDMKKGFVPTMGALHQGHISLLNLAKANNQLVISSLFVNPTQFNNPADLEKYPRPINQDLDILKKNGVDIAFVPDTEEIYGHAEPWHMDLGNLDKILEGKSRPGHFQGVTQIVKILFDLVKPDKAYFGLKDYQQYLVIKKLVQNFDLPIEIIGCPIIRESDGLAMSSRNLHLSETERKSSLILNKTLSKIKDLGISQSPEALRSLAYSMIEADPGVIIEYFDIAGSEDLVPVESWSENKTALALVAARVGQTRLIDNMFLNQDK